MNILAFLWHLAHKQVLVSGGLRRFIEVVSKGEKHDTRFTVIENSPHLRNSEGLLSYEPIEFRLPLDRYEDSLIIRLLGWIYYTLKATITGVTLTLERNFNIIMTPSGELFCTAIPAFIIHTVRRIPLAYVIQLAPPGLPSYGITSEYQRYRSQGFNILSAIGLSFYAYTTRVALVKLYNRAQLIITVSESLKKQLEQYGVRRRMYVVRNGIDVEEMERVTYRGPEIYDAIFVGRHTPEKGVFNLLEVWKEVVETIPTALLVLIGYCTWDVKKLVEKRIKQYNLTRNIVMKGVVPRSELILTMKQSKLFIFLSREESFALVIGEALACGLPVICYDIPPVKELYQADSVLQCHTGDTTCIIEKTINLLLDNQSRRELSIRAHTHVRRFKWEKTAEKEFQLYDSQRGAEISVY